MPGFFDPVKACPMTDPQNPATAAPALPPFAQDLADLIARLGLDETRAAGLLGVPVFTLRKWITGTRAPSAAAVRLVAVLGTLEAFAPALLEALTPAPAPAAPKRPRGRPAKPANAEA